MQQLFSQLGIDWHLLASQAVNFFLLLVVLRAFVYKPLLTMLRDRKQRIEDGLTKAREADTRLREVDMIGKQKIKAAEDEAVALIKKKEGEIKEIESKMLAEAKRKEVEALANTEVLLRAKEEESRRIAEKEAAALVKRAIAKTVELAPGKIDDALIAKAVTEAKQ